MGKSRDTSSTITQPPTSVKRSKRRNYNIMPTTDESNAEIAPQDELLMHTCHTLPPAVRKFWNRRYALFSKYDEGIMMTLDMWFLVTPEKVADMTARIFASLLPARHSVLEVCCGAGGNTIAFAKEFDTVVAIDIDANVVKCAENNLRVYGKSSQVKCIHGDWNHLSQVDGATKRPRTDWIPESVGEQFDVGFCSPPWGGPGYDHAGDDFNVLLMEPLALDVTLRQMLQYTRNVGMFLPKTSNLEQILAVAREIIGPHAQSRIVYMHNDGRLIAMLALFGPELTTGEYASEVFDYDAM